MMLHNYPAAVAACCRLLSHHPLTNLDPLVLLHRLSHLHYNTSTLFRPFVQPQQHCLAAVPAHCSGTNPCVRAAHNQPLYSNSITTTSSSCSSSSCVSRRGLTSTTMHATEGQQQPQHMIVLPMPSLSHAMTSGRVSHWLKQAGERCQQYDIIAEVGYSGPERPLRSLLARVYSCAANLDEEEQWGRTTAALCGSSMQTVWAITYVGCLVISWLLSGDVCGQQRPQASVMHSVMHVTFLVTQSIQLPD